MQDHTEKYKDLNVLLYWDNNKSRHPILATIPRDVLCILVTNTSIECLLSDSGGTIIDRHTRLQTTNFYLEIYQHL